MKQDFGGAWSATIVVKAEHAEAFELAFAGLASVVSLYEHGDSDSEKTVPWAVEGMFDAPPPREDLAARIALAAKALGASEPVLTIAKVPAKDWLTENTAAFPPLRAGRFYIHGDHIKGPFPTGVHRLEVNAATAFGSGEHASTMGCLLALDGLFRRGRGGFSGLDMGAGTGILAMAMAKARKASVLAADIDPEAVRVARYNVRRNGLGPRVACVLSDGCGLREIRARASYDVITANILARPLMAMARDLAVLLAPDGHLILAGFLRRHEAMVLAAYRMQGLKLARRYRLRPWTTLVLKK